MVENRAPTDAERLAHPLLARVDRPRDHRRRVSMDDPMAPGVVAPSPAGVPPSAPNAGRQHALRGVQRTLKLPTVGVSLVNHDNNQHGPDENLRCAICWEGIELLAAIMTMPAPGGVVVP